MTIVFLKVPMLLLFVLSEYFRVAADSFLPILTKNHGNFLFVHFHSAEGDESPLATAWSDFKINPPDIPTLSIGDVLCPASSALCANLTSGTFPNAIWLDPAFNLSVPFTPSQSITASSLRTFAKEMSTYPFIVGRDWEYARSRSDPWSPVPFVSCPVGGFSEVFPLLKTVFCRLGKTGVVRWQVPRELQVLRAGFKEVTFRGHWVENEMYEWLKRATLARCELLTDSILELLIEKGGPIVHFFIEPDRTIEEWMNFVQLFPPHQYTYLPYDPMNPFVDKFKARDLPLPTVIYYDPKTEFQVFYKGNFTYQDLGDWLAEIGSGETIPPPLKPMGRQGQSREFLLAGATGLVLSVVFVAVTCMPKRLATAAPAAFKSGKRFDNIQ
jgi:hypothetical protein